ncbi:MAG: EAL domain-containing protein [Campylobacterota bacterium]|nr:EAL domain-containing protein [Campylobacterota bacterium]
MDNINEIIKYSKNLKLLYVEDNEEARESTIIILEEFFDDITVAINGEDGYEKFEQLKDDIDLIITDINMPKLNGLEMIEKIRTINKDIPILVLSAYNESGFFMDSIKLGVEGYLLKPIDIEQFLGMLEKVTQKLKLASQVETNLHFLKEYESVTNESSIVSKTNLKGIMTYVNKEFCKISEYSKDELIGQRHNFIRHPDMPKEAFEDMWNTIQNKKQTWKGIVRNLTKSGKSYYVDATVKPILDEENNITEYIAVRNDITDIMNPQKQLDDAIKNSKDPLIVYMKLEEFDTLEEFYDHATVELIQDKTTKYLEKNIPQTCKFEKVYQLGHGEYAMTNEKAACMESEDYFIKQLKLYQEIIADGVIDIGDVDYDMSVIISLAYSDKKVLESSKLGIRELLKTKQDFIVSNNLAQIEQDKAQKNMEIISMVKKAISESKIISHFQPIINNKTQEIEKYESLVRLINDDGKVFSPFFFLDTAKKGKYCSQITNMVLDNSFSALKHTNMDISINLSALDIELKSTRDKLFKLLGENKEYSSKIVIELLEDENVKDFQTITDFINKVKKFGVKIAIDDFGAGYSNFERLLDYRPDILKIDGCLIRDIETNSYSRSVVKTIVAFAKEQNIQTVAEFIENEAIFNIVNEIGVDYSQGYYFGKPEALGDDNKNV